MTVRNVSLQESLVRVAAFLGLTFATLVGCASVLGVDKTYTLAEQADGGIRCAGGGESCTPGVQECCLAADSTLRCVDGVDGGASDPCPGGTDIACDDPADCPGGVCCMQLDRGNALLGTACRSSCPVGQANGAWRELCAAGADTCASGTCQPLSDVMPSPPFHAGWFYACQP
jgi:hypothetical protein